MIRSMTGYGGAKGVVEGLNVTVELKSVNNRYLDIAVRMPRNFLFAEDAVKSTIQQHVSRGKLDVFVTIDSSCRSCASRTSCPWRRRRRIRIRSAPVWSR